MDRVVFRVNGETQSVGSEVRSDLSLLEWLRVRKELRGTKYLCRQGGCGSCIVTATRPGTGPVGVNSCLVSVTSCQDWEITTIEGVGNRLKGYHPLQTTLAKNNGTQCGYCSPGWVMAMYSLLQSKRHLTMLEIEKSFGSNICRCTGYRPILEAFKRFASDAEPHLLDIEDLSICQKTGRSCRNSGSSCEDWCIVEADDVEGARNIEFELKDGKCWARVQTVRDVFYVLLRKGDDSYMLVNGNTAKGAYPILEYPRVLIDISGIQELKGYRLDQNLILGAGSTLTETIQVFEYLSSSMEDFRYLEKLKEHLLMVAHIPVRNLASIAGNLMLKYQHRDFQSDVFLLLEAAGAYLTIVDKFGAHTKVTPVQFLDVNMRSKVILNVLLPPLGQHYQFVSFKIMPRSQNVHAIVHSAFLLKLTPETTVSEARLVYGGLSPNFVHARQTERFLLGRQLFTNDTLQGAIQVLDSELEVVENPPEPSVQYRRNLAVNLFYKSMLCLCPTGAVRARFASGAITLSRTRPVSRARQFVPTDPANYPLNQPIPKVEALRVPYKLIHFWSPEFISYFVRHGQNQNFFWIGSGWVCNLSGESPRLIIIERHLQIQCAGEAPYTEDLPQLPYEVFGAFVLADQFGDIVDIDPSQALKYPGVITFYSAKDIPGVNSFTPNDLYLNIAFEEIFCSGPVRYNGQVIGVIVAELRAIADFAAKLVRVTYRNVKKPAVDIKETKNHSSRTKLLKEIKGGNKGKDVSRVIKGEETIYQQTHFSIETLVSVAVPTEEGLKVRCATQSTDLVQIMISRALLIPENKIDVYVRRLGGAYGVKISRTTQVAVVSALVSLKLNRPCRIILPLETVSKAIGKRVPCSTDFEVAVNSLGEIQYCNEKLTQDNGYVDNEQQSAVGAAGAFNNCYDKSRWNFKLFEGTTDTASNTAMRAPEESQARCRPSCMFEELSTLIETNAGQMKAPDLHLSLAVNVVCVSDGTLEAVISAEFILERIAYEMTLDPLEVRLRNLDPKFTNIREMVAKLKEDAQYLTRRAAVDKYNAEHRWKKRGLRFSFMRFSPYLGAYFDVTLSVFHDDGTVAVVHGGIEMGQGVNTKAVQIAAYFLRIPIDRIQIKANNTMITPNALLSAGSVTSRNIGIGVQQCCEELLARLAPIRATMPNASWQQLVKAAFLANVDLQTHGFVSDAPMYDAFGVTLSEVEIDVLTGEWEVLRVDLLEDAGLSLSPAIDIGQVEGSFIMGLGYWTTEQIVFGANGKVLTDRTWNYYVPLARDIPQDFRVYFKKNSFSDKRILGAKPIGEPATCMAVSVAFALREAIAAARCDTGIPTNQWFQIDGPYTREAIQLSTATKYSEYKFY